MPNDLRRIMDEFERRINNRRPIENSYEVTKNIYAGEYPRNKDDDSSYAKMKQFESFGITHFVDLTEEGELQPYESLLYKGAKYLRFPIRDVCVPQSIESVRGLIAKITKAIKGNSKAKVYIHCWGGVGRTGLIVGCLLGELYRQDYDETLKRLEQLFAVCPKSAKRHTPETAEQHKFIASYIQGLKQNDIKDSEGNPKEGVRRFVDAQNAAYAGYKQALEEVRNGRKVWHWIWYVFPQMRGLGHSERANYYGIADREEAEDYLLNFTLNDRIHEISEALLQHKGKSVYKIFGEIDAMKVQSSMTLFDAISPNDVFGKVLDQFYGGVRDKRTLGLINEDEDDIT